MANSYFQFKQFRVEQGASAMKVCTDACIQGAYTAAFLQGKNLNTILDIGAGTGLLSLMLAQETDALIEAIELDDRAYEQAAFNFAGSPWSSRLQVIQGDVRNYGEVQYQFIITNPPFYEHDLKSPDHQRNKAMHTLSLDHEALLTSISRLLEKDGQFSILLPYQGFQRFCKLATEAGFQLSELLEVRQTPKHGVFRCVGIFGRMASVETHQELIIRGEDGQYTLAFEKLLKDYYLHL